MYYGGWASQPFLYLEELDLLLYTIMKDDVTHSFKQWLEDTTVGAASFGNEEDPDERGLKRIGHLKHPVPDSQMAADLFGVKFMSKQPKKSGKRRKSFQLGLATLPLPNQPRT